MRCTGCASSVSCAGLEPGAWQLSPGNDRGFTVAALPRAVPQIYEETVVVAVSLP